MRPPHKGLAPRGLRIAAFFGLATLFSFSAASAQADKNWLEMRLDRTLRLSSPWDLPPSPELDAPQQTKASAASLGTQSMRSNTQEVLSSRKFEAVSQEAKRRRLEIRSVDDFEDPWAGRVIVESAPVVSSEPTDSPHYQENPELIDPWAD